MVRRKLTGLSGKDVVRALQRGGFEILRVRGSHRILRRPGVPASTVIVPVHGTRDLPPGTVRSIIDQSGLTDEQFTLLL